MNIVHIVLLRKSFIFIVIERKKYFCKYIHFIFPTMMNLEYHQFLFNYILFYLVIVFNTF